MKKIFAFFAAICLILSCQAVIWAEEPAADVAANTETKTVVDIFSDVDETSSVGKDILKLYNAGIINGHGDGTFAPNDPVTRAQLCKMVNNICGFTAKDETGFTDVTPNNWYYDHVLVGKKAGYINGYPDGTFGGDKYISREQVCAIIFRAFGVYDLGIDVGITDPVSLWAVSYVNAMVSNMLIPLETGNTFRAQENMTRAELSTAIAKFVVEQPEEDKKEENPYAVSVKDSKGIAIEAIVSYKEGMLEIILPEGKILSKTSKVTVLVTDKDGKNVKGISVTVKDSKNNAATGKTNDKGIFSATLSTGDSAAGGPSGGPGGTGDTNSKQEIIAANAQTLKYLKDVKADLAGKRFTGTQKEIIDKVMVCVNDAIRIGESGERIISNDFVNTNYRTQIAEAKAMYVGLSDENKAAFRETLMQAVSQETQDYLISVFF